MSCHKTMIHNPLQLLNNYVSSLRLVVIVRSSPSMAAAPHVFSSLGFQSHHLRNTRFQLLPRRGRQRIPSLHRVSPSLTLNSDNPRFRLDPSLGSFYNFASPQFSLPSNCFDQVFFRSKDDSVHWNFAPGRVSRDWNGGIYGDGREPEVTVVVLGWLGAKPKHLRRYVELYNGKGIHAVTFVASVMDVLWVDFGKSLEERIERLARELAQWLLNEDGRERFLMFHTFSNTGWLTYGAILNHFKDRKDLMEKIRGCVVDSGGDPNLDPKVWAAGFTTALLKKKSSGTYPSMETSTGTQRGSMPNELKMEVKETSLTEALMFSAFENLFTFLLDLPLVKQKLTKTISCLSKNQPPCPQLYLYSTGDKVIPFQAIESFIEDQKRAGKDVCSFNFGPSPHVDHYRTFPEVYTSQLENFLKNCLSVVGIL